MRRLLKAALIASGAAVLVVVAAPFVLERLLPAEKARGMIVAEAQKSLHRQVRLEGVSYGLIHGLTLENLSVSEAPDFSAGTMLSVRRFRLKVSWLALLHKRVVVDRVAAEGLRVSVAKGADGRYNFSDLLEAARSPSSAAGSPPPPAAASGGPAFSLGIRSASISDGRLDYADKVTGDSITVSALQAKVDGFALSGSFDASLSARARGRWQGRSIDGAAAVSGRFDLGGSDPKRFAADVKSLSAEYDGLTLKGSGRVRGLGPYDGAVDLTLSDEHRRLLAISWAGTLNRQPSAAYGVEGKGDLNLKTSGFQGIELAPLGVPATLTVPGVAASGRLNLMGDAVSADALALDTPVGSATLSGKLSRLGQADGPVPDLTAVLNLDLPSLSAAQLPAGLLPRGLTLPAMKLTGAVKAAADSVSFQDLRAAMKAGRVDVSGTVTALKETPRYDLDIRAKVDFPRLSAAQLAFLSAPEGFRLPAVGLDGRAHLDGDTLTTPGLSLRTQAGTIELSGKIDGLTSGSPSPALDVAATLSLPALSASDIPFGWAPSGFALPPSRWDGKVFFSRDEARAKSLRVVIGRNDVELENARLWDLRSAKPQVDGTVKCRQFSLEELSGLTPALRQMALSGNGYFALSARGPLSRPILAGKLQFKTLGAVVDGLHLSGFTGTASFDERRIDIPNLDGKVENGDLQLDLTVQNYVTHPAVDLQAELSEFDLGRLLAAKERAEVHAQERAQRRAAAVSGRPSAAARPGASAKPAQPEQPLPIDLKGKLTVGKILHPNFDGSDVRAEWDVVDLTPDLRQLSGSAKFSVAGGGHLVDLDKSGGQSKLVRILMFPLMIIQKLGKLIVGFPDLNNVAFSQLTGDYVFSRGLMTIRDSRMESDAGNVTAGGTIDLPQEKLDMSVTADVRKMPAPIDVAVGGTFDHPQPHVKLAKMAKQLLENPGKQLLQNLLGH